MFDNLNVPLSLIKLVAGVATQETTRSQKDLEDNDNNFLIDQPLDPTKFFSRSVSTILHIHVCFFTFHGKYALNDNTQFNV